MTIKYCDWVSGDDSSGDGSYSNPYKTIQKSLTGLTGGDEVRVGKSGSNIALTGTLAFTRGDTNVVGTGTLFSSELVVGDFIRGYDGLWYYVSDITDDLNLALSFNYEGAIHSGASSSKLTYIDIGAVESNTVWQTIDQSGTSSISKLKVSGGWDLGTQTQIGVTCYRQNYGDSECLGIALQVALNKQYLTIEKFIFVDFEVGISAPRNSAAYYMDINYVETVDCSANGLLLGSDTSIDHCVVSPGAGCGLNLTYGFNSSGSINFTCTNSHFSSVGGDVSTCIWAVNSSNILFDTCIINNSGIVIARSSLVTLRNINQTGGISSNGNGSFDGGVVSVVMENITGSGGIGLDGSYTVGHSFINPGQYVNLSSINIEGSIGLTYFAELQANDITCAVLNLSFVPAARIDILNTNNPGLAGFGTDMPGTIITNYNAHGSASCFSEDNSAISYKKEPIFKVQKFYLNSNTTPRYAILFGSGIIERNDTGGRTGNACIQMSSTVAAGVGVTQRCTFFADYGVAKEINFYAKSINGFDGVLKARVMFNGIEVGPLTTISLTGSYVQHTFNISAGSITENGVLVLELVATGSTGHVLIDEVEAA